MFIKYTIAIFAMLFGLNGCVTVKTLQATGGSRADGTVYLSYEYGGFEQPKVQWDDGLITARQRCNAWGYADAEPFGGQKSACQYANAYGCLRFLVTVTYQCTGGGESKQ